MKRLQGELPVPSKPPLGCPDSNPRSRGGHALHFDGWWQSGNPEVAIPRWRCACGKHFTDAPRARCFRDGQLGELFHGPSGAA